MTPKEKIDYAINFAKKITNKSNQEICDYFEYVEYEIIYWKWAENPQEYFEGLLEIYFLSDLNKNNLEIDFFSFLDFLRYELKSCRSSITDDLFLKDTINFLVLLNENHLDLNIFFEILSDTFDFASDKVLIQNIIKNHSEKGKSCIKEIILNQLSDESIQFYLDSDMQEFIDTLFDYKRLYVDFEPIIG